MDNLIEPGTYRHYKGNYYEVSGICTHSETLEKMVIYKRVEKDDLWVRPLKMFFELVMVNGNEVKRFEKVEK